MLNDLARQTRTTILLQMLSFGLTFGALVGLGSDGTVALVLFAVGLVSMLLWVAGVVVWNRRADRAFKARLVRASDEIVSGRVPAVPAPGRVHRRRIARKHPAYVASRGEALPGPAVVLAVTVLAEGGARRVGALVPALVGLESRRAPVALLLHPDEPEAAVLDDRVTPEQVAAIAADPRWASEPLPTDRTVVGGYLPLLGCAVLGVLAGVGLDLLVLALAT